jgi:hypothetical protein
VNPAREHATEDKEKSLMFVDNVNTEEEGAGVLRLNKQKLES